MLMRPLMVLLSALPLLAEEVIAPAVKGIETQVYFSPDGGCTDAIVRELGAAKKEIRVQPYGFTSKIIAGALRDAVARGVFDQAILDKSPRTEK